MEEKEKFNKSVEEYRQYISRQITGTKDVVEGMKNLMAVAKALSDVCLTTASTLLDKATKVEDDEMGDVAYIFGYLHEALEGVMKALLDDEFMDIDPNRVVLIFRNIAHLAKIGELGAAMAEKQNHTIN